MSSLTDKFQNYVGQTVRNPNRRSCDVCHVTADLAFLAAQEGLMLSFKIAGKHVDDMDDVLDPEFLFVNLEENAQGQFIIDSIDIN